MIVVANFFNWLLTKEMRWTQLQRWKKYSLPLVHFSVLDSQRHQHTFDFLAKEWE